MSDTRARILRRLSSKGTETAVEPPDFGVRSLGWNPEERLARFRTRMEAVHGEVQEVGDDWPQRLFELVRDKGGRNLLYGPRGPHAPELENSWPDRRSFPLIPYDAPVESCRDALFRTTDAGFTSCRGAVAETGSLVLWPTPEEPRLLSLIPPIHFVLLDRTEIRSTYHELLAEQAWSDGMPSNALLISGPSKSADIEQTLAYGVHGPKELLVLIR